MNCDQNSPPGAARPASNLAEIFSLVETGSVVFFAPASVARRYPRSGIAYRPATEPAACPLTRETPPPQAGMLIDRRRTPAWRRRGGSYRLKRRQNAR